MITLQIDVGNLGVLDGLSLLTLDAPGVEVNTVDNRSYIVIVPPSIPVGRVNLGDIIPSIGGRPVLLSVVTVASSLPYVGPGNALQRVTPVVGSQQAVQQIADLTARQGMAFFSCPEIFPLAHLLAVTTNVGGPHRIICVLKVLTDDDVAKMGTGCAGGGTSELVTQQEGAVVVPQTGVNNFVGAGVGVEIAVVNKARAAGGIQLATVVGKDQHERAAFVIGQLLDCLPKPPGQLIGPLDGLDIARPGAVMGTIDLAEGHGQHVGRELLHAGDCPIRQKRVVAGGAV